MNKLTPQIIAEVTGGQYIGEDSARDDRVAGAAHDDREVRQGNLFVCISGKKVDGHSFANRAFEAGAACCLAEHHIEGAKGPYVLVNSTQESFMAIGAYYRSLFSIPFIGLTGSVGKTTAKELVAAALGGKFNVLKTNENKNNEIGVPLTLLSLEDNHEAAVIEMGIRDFGDMSLLAKMVRPDIFIMTKIGYSHLKELGDLHGVLKAKTEAFAYMKPDGVAVINGDDEFLWGYEPGMKRITFGIGARNDFRAENIQAEGTDAVLCDVVSDTGRFPIRIPAYGTHLAPMALSAAAVGRLLGMEDEEISRGLLSYAPVGGRANVTNTGAITLIDDCYNSNPNSVRAALSSLSSLHSRRVAILGDMKNLGVHAVPMHYEIGVCAAQNGVDRLICCGPEALDIYKGYMSAGKGEASYYATLEELMTSLPGMIEHGDAVLVKASRDLYFEKLLPLLRNII